MTTPLTQAKVGLLLPAILNPATAATVCAWVIAVGFLRLLNDEEEKEPAEAVPTNRHISSVFDIFSTAYVASAKGLRTLFALVTVVKPCPISATLLFEHNFAIGFLSDYDTAPQNKYLHTSL